ncbi:type VI secretion system Vgr family protein [Paraburkholderia phenoliruptrix]|uniref:type VI secretion system Vgr family protein n=1 Tax=Paraburkholderia phenoliruptrix TaxID=252970 RepID=UPI002869D526|nr:type VI secretion system Vgr family protein [Paraburkholderia phenoliruptrix]WMY08001.1 type VI secretion system Vgr family protein [Paraburkholderia phenoliruptrix]
MNSADLLRAFASGVLDQNNRPIRLQWGHAQKALEQVLIIQRIDIKEGLCAGIEGHLTCVSTRADLPLKVFIGLPVSVQLVTDRKAIHQICGLITDARAGQSDGSLATYQLTIRDALSVLERRVNTRIFRTKNVPDVIEILLREWQKKSPALASAFDFDLSGINRSQYPVRELIFQFHESDADFIRRLCRRDGIAWFTAAGKRGQAPSDGGSADTPVHTLVLFDDSMKLAESAAGTIRYHRDAATEERDSVTLWSASQQLVPGSVKRASWDYKAGTMAQASESNLVDQGPAGNDLSQLLSDSVIDVPHAGDSWSDYDRLGKARMLSHELRAVSVEAASGVRDLAVGRWFELTGHPEVDTRAESERQFVVTALHHRAENNLPKDLNERALALFEANRWHFDSLPTGFSSAERCSSDDVGTRYHNVFTCVRRGIALTPSYDPRIDLPRVYPITAMVVGPEGEEVYCDELGRIKVQIQGLDPDDHAHAQGVGISGTDRDSAFVRVSTSLAGQSFGHTSLPRVGMEVSLDFLNGDPDKMFVTGVLHNGPNKPAAFSHTGSLPGNRYVSGIKTKEIKAARYNQLRFDDTPGQVSGQLASEHAYSQLNLGYLTQPRDNGQGQDRGEGAELRTDAAAALRAARGILLTTYARTQASGNQLDRDELVQLLGQCTELFKSLGDYAGQHGGQAADTAGQNAVASAFREWTPGSASGAGASSGGSQALMAFGAQAGSVNVTPKTHVSYAGENIDNVAQQHLQLVSGQRWVGHAGQGMQLFAMANGISAIANQGNVQLQAQAGDVVIQAQKDLHVAATGDVYIRGEKIHLVASDGSYYTIGGGHEMGSDGRLNVKTAGHSFNGPATQQSTPLNFGKDGTKQRYQLHYPGHTEDSPMLAANQAYKITMSDGRVIQGTSDAQGLTDLLQDDVMRIARIDVLKPQL